MMVYAVVAVGALFILWLQEKLSPASVLGLCESSIRYTLPRIDRRVRVIRTTFKSDCFVESKNVTDHIEVQSTAVKRIESAVTKSCSSTTSMANISRKYGVQTYVDTIGVVANPRDVLILGCRQKYISPTVP